MTTTGITSFAIDPTVFLPGAVGGRIQQNSLPTVVDSFVYLKVDADLTPLGGGFSNPYTVYVPCYFTQPDTLFNSSFTIYATQGEDETIDLAKFVGGEDITPYTVSVENIDGDSGYTGGVSTSIWSSNFVVTGHILKITLSNTSTVSNFTGEINFEWTATKDDVTVTATGTVIVQPSS